MRFITFSLLCLLAGTAHSVEWIRYFVNDISVIYADPINISRNGNIVKMWSMSDFKFAQGPSDGDHHWSERILYEFDCSQKMSRRVYVRRYSGQMEHGDVLFTSKAPTEWMPVISQTIHEKQWRLACGNRR